MFARKNFGQILNEAALLGETFIIERAGKPMAALVPVEAAPLQDSVDTREVERALEQLIKRIKGDRSKKLEKAIAEAKEAVKKLNDHNGL